MVMFTTINITHITNVLNKIAQNDEIEAMFYNYKSDNKLSIVKFMHVLKYLKLRSETDKLKLDQTTSLDISFDYELNSKYRVSINGIKSINEFLNLVHQRTNHIIFSILLSQPQFIKDDNFKYIKKTNDTKNLYDIDQFDIRIRKSSEEPLSENDMKKIQNSSLNSMSKIFFRYKNRISLILIDNENEKLAIDITIVQSSNNPNNIYSSAKTYEIELDYSLKNDKKIGTKTIDTFINEIETIKKILENTNNVIPKTEIAQVIQAYKKLVFMNENVDNNLYSMQPISVEVQHVVDKIPNKYSVTDKADGDRSSLFIFENSMYMLSTNLNVIKTDYTSNLNNTILDGELIYISKEKRYLYMAFDCLFYNNLDIRNEVLLANRLKYANDACKSFGTKLFKFKDSSKIDMKKQEKFFTEEIKGFYEHLNKLLKNNESIIFHPKFFIFPTGSDNSEVFLYSYLFWNVVVNEEVCPYKLDGIIYTGVEQKYTKDKKEQKYPIYKYKPPETNSLDVYINFVKNIDSGGYLDVYDNTISDIKDSKVYRTTNLFVGDTIGNKEIPVLFLKEEMNHEVYFPIVKGAVRDVDGNFVQDSTVIEIIYNNDPNIPHPYRWIILRTRWDKTESVITKQKRYGNFKDTAIKTWKSIREAITIDEIKNLSNPTTYPSQQKLLQNRLNSTVISTERQQDVYYQKITNLASKMRKYHNWIKSIIIYTYCSPAKEFKDGKEKKLSVLDIGCGRGGDLLKFYHARVGDYIGIDPDYNNIYSSTNGIVSRYNQFKKTFPDFSKVIVIQADGSIQFNSTSQELKLLNMTKQNKELLDKTFTKNRKFDIINSSFAIHYLFDSQSSVKNLIENIKSYLKIGGYILLTLFDPAEIIEKLQDKDSYTSYYTDENGSRNKFYEIVKKFDGPLEDKVGQAIDVHMAWIMEDGKYETEYLVTPKLLNKTMEKANCRLVETDLLSNLYYLNQPYFTEVIEHEENPKNLKLYRDFAEYYGDLKGIDKESRNYTFLSRYYVYQKMA
jgi:SAM-dependent methyltransferase